MSVSHVEWTGSILLGGRYKILRRLGFGGMALVYLARDQKLQTDVVIKVPSPAILQHPNFAGRFQREVRMMVKLSHKHIVRVLDTDTHEGQPFAVLEYLPGGTLRDQQLRDPRDNALPMPVESLHAWLADVASALDYIHQNGYIHRDVKPANILFDNQGHACLADFGIAKTLSATDAEVPATALTQTGTILGTPQYMAPEMILGKAFDHRVDQYALAVTIYEYLSGRYPFDGPNPTAIFVQQAKDAASELVELLPGIPSSLSGAVQRALSKKAGQRFSTCEEFARAVLADVPLVTRTRVAVPAPVVRAETPKARSDTEPLARGTPPSEQAPIPYDCPNCRRKILVRLGNVRRRYSCPHCKGSFTIAPPPPPPGAPGVVVEPPFAERVVAPLPPGAEKRPEKFDVELVRPPELPEMNAQAYPEEWEHTQTDRPSNALFWCMIVLFLLSLCGGAAALVFLLR